MTEVGDYWVHTAIGMTGITVWQIISTIENSCTIQLRHQFRTSKNELGTDVFYPDADKRTFSKDFLQREDTPWEPVDGEDIPLILLRYT